jgi:hypothetical protein
VPFSRSAIRDKEILTWEARDERYIGYHQLKVGVSIDEALSDIVLVWYAHMSIKCSEETGRNARMGY